MITLEEVKELNKNKLSLPNNFKAINELGEYIIASFQLKNAIALARNLESKLALSDKSVLNEQESDYQKLIARLKFLALNFCNEKELMELFEKQLAYALGDDSIVIMDRINALMIEYLITERNEIKRRIRERLLANEQLLTKGKLEIDGISKLGTIGNWLNDYIKNTGAGEVDRVEVAKYLGRNNNIINSSQEEKTKITDLINIFNLLQTSSMTPEGLEESLLFSTSDGAIHLLSKGFLEKIDQKRRITPSSKLPPIEQPIKLFENVKEEVSVERNSNISTKDFSRNLPPVPPARPFEIAPEPGQGAEAMIPEEELTRAKSEAEEEPVSIAIKETAQSAANSLTDEILRIYQGSPKDQGKIGKEEGIVKAAIKGDNLKLRDEFYKAVQKKKIYKTIAILRIMAEMDEMDNFLREDEKLKKFLLSVWPKMYGPAIAGEFKKDPGSWQSVKLFVQYILQKRLNLADSESARIGAQIGNIFKRAGREDLSKMAYFDTESRTFKWLED